MGQEIDIDGTKHVIATDEVALSDKITDAMGGAVCKVYSVSGLKPDEPAGHLVYVPDDAIADRKARHGLATDEEALAVIMQEHHARLNPKE